MLSSRPAICAGVRWSVDLNPMSGATSLDISRAPRLLVRKISVRSKFTTVLSPRLSVPLSRMPSSSSVSDGAAFSTSSNRTSDRSQPDEVDGAQALLREERLGLAMSEVARRRTDQLRDLVIGLELSAINFEDSLRRPCRTSASASTVRVLPVPVGPRRRKMPAGRSGGARPA